MATTRLTDMQLDALRELANIGSGNAGTALSAMVGREVGISVPRALALPLAEAVEAAGPAEEVVTGVVIPIGGGIDGFVLLLFPRAAAETLCTLLGASHGGDECLSALAEIGNILGTSYMNALAALSGMELLPGPPQTVIDMVAAIVSTVLAAQAGTSDTALLLDSDLHVSGEACSLTFMLLPTDDGVTELLSRLGVEG